MSRFFVDQKRVLESTIIIDSPEDIRHMTKVLRLKEGDLIDVSDSAEFEYRCALTLIGKDVVEAKILDKQKFAREPITRITLYQGIPKQGKMEAIVQKTVELGVDSIVPVFMDRTVVADKGTFHKKVERYQKVAAEAVKQCKRGMIPPIRQAMTFSDALKDLEQYDLLLFPYENEENISLKHCLRAQQGPAERIAVFIGPEGGFSQNEAEALEQAGAHSVSLGRTILRTETAGMTAIAMLMYELELWS